jgi:DNA-binding transcriptional MocR family regulator
MPDVTELERQQLSRRGERLLTSPPTAEYLAEHFVRSTSPYDREGNPEGYIPLCVAENRLVWALLQPRLAACRDVPHNALCYDDMTGSASFRARLARFLAERVLGRGVTPEQVAVLAGAGSVLEILFYALADPGDAVLIPTPSYAGFWPDLETRDELRRRAGRPPRGRPRAAGPGARPQLRRAALGNRSPPGAYRSGMR